jgi:hypothetical protein
MNKIPHYLPIQTVESRKSGLIALKLTEEPYSGIIYTYGMVSFDEDKENQKLNLRFEYEIVDYAGKTIDDKPAFESYIGVLLEELIHIQIAENSMTYTGGIDENRTEDSNQSDT